MCARSGSRTGGRQALRPPRPAASSSNPPAAPRDRRAQLCRAPAPRHAARREFETGDRPGTCGTRAGRSGAGRRQACACGLRAAGKAPAAPPPAPGSAPRARASSAPARPDKPPAAHGAGVRSVGSRLCRAGRRYPDRRDAETLAKQLAAKVIRRLSWIPSRARRRTSSASAWASIPNRSVAEGGARHSSRKRSSSRPPGSPGNQLHETTPAAAG